jgi:hypothetical protein
MASWRRATGQGGAWVATPAHPTVGDTVWLERAIAVPPGWRVRAGTLEATEAVEPLANPSVRPVPGGWLVRYPIVAWRPGAQPVVLPPLWRLGPDGRADSLPGGAASFSVQHVIPDTLRQPEPQGAIAPVRSQRRDPLPPLAAALVAGVVLAAGLKWRRRRPRAVPRSVRAPLDPEVPDARWLAAGEPKAVAARAAHRLRAAVHRAIPDAHPALSTAERLAAVERARPGAPLRELRDLLEQLDRVAFAATHGTDVAALAQMARRLAQELVR